MPPNFVVVGHVTHDLVGADGARRLGGAAAYAALTAHRLGRSVGVVTSAGPDLSLAGFPPEIEVALAPSPQTTTFRNEQTPHGRRQYVTAQAARLDVEQVPWPWLDAQVILAAPVLNEVDPTMLGRFRKSLVGVGAQGLLRRWTSADAPLQQRGLEVLAALPPVGVVFLSDEDVAGPIEDVPDQLERTPIVVVTRGARGAHLWWQGGWRDVPAFPPAKTVDETGAGDVFATAFLVRLSETRDPLAAARFASAAASLSVEAAGVEAAPLREAVERRMAAGEV